ncbi:MAG TPA: glycine cleavage system aminomethyltransferase GcvT [Myxococcota bacterium]|nr:glycine cleavage system aminomethyltransferase GcvT [Myxococcota bacterium]
MTEALAHTPLHSRHLAAGARMVPFAGFDMPVLYGSILEEHRAVRRSAGLFDVSHMGEVRLRGRDAAALAQRLFTNDVAGMQDGQVRYGLFCLESGGVVDDVTLYRVGADDWLFCVNASNIAGDLAWLRLVHARSDLDCAIEDQSERTALLAIQGPAALEIAAAALPGSGPAPRRWRFARVALGSGELWLSRTGYTGEDGYEIFAPAAQAGELWDRLREAGGERLALAGLGARDTLRTEMGYPLYGHELDRDTNPHEAGLERFVAFERDFVGSAALAALRRSGPARRLVGLLLEAGPVARPGAPIRTAEGDGRVTSGTFAPSVERSIAIGYVPARAARAGERVQVEIRGRRIDARITEFPFYRKR